MTQKTALSRQWYTKASTKHTKKEKLKEIIRDFERNLWRCHVFDCDVAVNCCMLSFEPLHKLSDVNIFVYNVAA